MSAPKIESDCGRLSIESVERHAATETFAEAVAAGLGAPTKTLHCRFLYDPQGSQLFERICELPEYYPTRVERQILEDCVDEVARDLPELAALVELGSGSAAKTRIVIETFLARNGELVFVPIDISRSILESSSHELLETYPELEIRAIEAEYEAGLARVRESKALDADGSRLILWLGSSIGNLDRDAAAEFLAGLGRTLRPHDRLLVGIDLRKDRATLERAYDDSLGITAEFNLNLLRRINRELGGRFELEHFAHRAVYDDEAGRIEMHLVSLREQQVVVEGIDREFAFAENETIHTENSYKYSEAEITGLAARAGLAVENRWSDAGERFSVNLLRAK